MNVEKALFLFGLTEIDKKEIRKRYLRKCREYHPDKHIGATDEERREYNRKFNELQDAYMCLNDDDQTANMMNDVFEKNILALGLKLIKHIKTYEFRQEHIYSILELLDDDSLNYIYSIIGRYKGNPIIGEVSKWIEGRISSVNIPLENVVCEDIRQVEISPTLNDLFNGVVKCIEHNEKKYYIPVWHRYICMGNVEATMEPFIVLDEKEVSQNGNKIYHVFLDDENGLHIYVVSYIEDIFKNEKCVIDVYVGDEQYKTFEVSGNEIRMKKEQLIVLESVGIPLMNKQNIYDDTVKGNVYIYLQMVT